MKSLSEMRDDNKPDDAEMQDWLGLSDKLLDLATLVKWAEQSLPSAEVPCVCSDGGCLRCQTEWIVDKNRTVEKPADVADEELPF